MAYSQVLAIGEILISSTLLTERFACNLTCCKGACCVEGSSGAPLEEYEIELLKQAYHSFAPFMTPQGREAVQQQGVALMDSDGDLVTPLVAGIGECAYACFSSSVCVCAIESAFFQGKTTFRKPISCWLYPIRVQPLSTGCALNVHCWSLCAPARIRGRKEGIPLYLFLKEPLIAKFGVEFYEELTAAAQSLF